MYFFKTVEVKKEIRVVPVENQFFSPTEPVKTSWYVKCSKATRASVPVGSIFYSESLSTVSGKDCYQATIYPISSSTSAELTYKTFIGKSTAGTVDKEPIKKITVKGTIDSDPALTAPDPVADSFYVDKNKWSLLVRNIKNHVNTMIIGPTGTGKTNVVKKLCDKMGLQLNVFDMGSMVDPISSLLGVHRLEKGESTFDYAKFTQVIQEPGVILLDELSRAAFSTMNILFPCLDDRRKLSIEIASGKGVREINVHPEVTFIATANIGAEYTGTNTMDRALTNRFFPIEMGNIPDEEEIKVLVNRSRITAEEAKSIVKVANTLRNLYTKQELSVGISIRETLLVADLVRDGWSLGEAMELVYLPLFEGTKTDGERKMVFNTFASY